MKNEILDIAKKLYHNHLTPETATNLLLDLFAVIKSVCEHDYMQRGGAVKYYRCVKCGNEKI